MSGCVVETAEETRLGKTQLESAEFARQKLNDIGHLWWWDEQAVYAMDNTVCAELEGS